MDSDLPSIPQETDPNVIKLIKDNARRHGNAAFREKSYKEAIKQYCVGIAAAPDDVELLSNRATAYMALGRAQDAAADGAECIRFKPDWPKGYFRLGSALIALERWEEAAAALQKANKLMPSSIEIADRLKTALQGRDRVRSEKRVALITERLQWARKLREARLEDTRNDIRIQIANNIMAAGFTVEDILWRPVWSPRPKQREHPVDLNKFLQRKSHQLILFLVELYSEFKLAEHSIHVLADIVRLQAYQQAIKSALAARPGAHVLVMSDTPAILALLAARYGATHVTCICRTKMLCRLTEQILEANINVSKGIVQVVNGPIRACHVAGALQPKAPAGTETQHPAVTCSTIEAAQSASDVHWEKEERNSAMTDAVRTDFFCKCTPRDPNLAFDSSSCSGPILEDKPPLMSTGHTSTKEDGTISKGKVYEGEGRDSAGEAKQNGGENHRKGGSINREDDERENSEHMKNCRASGIWGEMNTENKDHLTNTEENSDQGNMKEEMEDGAGVKCMEEKMMKEMAPREGSLTASYAGHAQVDAEEGRGTKEGSGSSEMKDPPNHDWVRLLPSRAEVLVSDLFDHALVGKGMLGAFEHIRSHLLTPDAILVPSSTRVYAYLAEMRISEVSGFDLSPMNAYRWHPQLEKVADLSSTPHKRLSETFVIASVNLHEGGAHASPHGDGGPGCTPTSVLLIQERTAHDGQKEVWEVRASAMESGVWNAVVLWFELDLGMDKRGDMVTLSSGGEGAPQRASSWGHAVQYLDEMKLEKGQEVALAVHWNTSALWLERRQPPPPPPQARHGYCPRWHFDMLLDSQRNQAYEQAIQRAIGRKKKMGCHKPRVLDIGAGSGLLSMMAARAGAAAVTAVEMSPHMADVCEEIVCINGYGATVAILQKDGRRVTCHVKSDGSPPDVQHLSDILVYEVFDNGLIGEGVLHSVAAARENLLTSSAILVPMAATVFCCGIELQRFGDVCGFDFEKVNAWRWKPDYEGVDLNGLPPSSWKPLTRVVKAFEFDFYNHSANLQPAETPLELPVTDAGIVNTIAFWFDLQLDEEVTLGTGPWQEKGLGGGGGGRTWKQAVQRVEELKVSPNHIIPVVARQNTYGISFALDGSRLGTGLRGTRASPLVDDVWHGLFKAVESVNETIAKNSRQNPRKFKKYAGAAMEIAHFPASFGIDPEIAGEMCARFMT